MDDEQLIELKSAYDGGVKKGIIIGIILTLVLMAITGAGKYNGEDAEYWYNAYDSQVAETDTLIDLNSQAIQIIEDCNDGIEEVKEEVFSYYFPQDYGEEIAGAVYDLDECEDPRGLAY